MGTITEHGQRLACSGRSRQFSAIDSPTQQPLECEPLECEPSQIRADKAWQN
jgi:hypothetical protein